MCRMQWLGAGEIPCDSGQRRPEESEPQIHCQMTCRLSLSSSVADFAGTRLHHPQESGASGQLAPGDRFTPARRQPNSVRAVLSSASKRGLPSSTTILKNNVLIDIHPEVAEGPSARKPVVAQESTILTHAMPTQSTWKRPGPPTGTSERLEVCPPLSVSLMDVSKLDWNSTYSKG